MIERRLAVMKRELVFSVGVVIMGIGQFALAGEPAGPSPQTLGTVEAILGKCADIDPKHAARYHDEVQAVIQNASSESVAETRKSAAYRQAYDSAAESMSERTESDAIRACTDSLGESK
jgi:hypothetical protein